MLSGTKLVEIPINLTSNFTVVDCEDTNRMIFAKNTKYYHLREILNVCFEFEILFCEFSVGIP